MKTSQIAAQLYTLRDHLATPAQIAQSLRRVKKIGYNSVQVSGTGPIEAKELNAILEGEGIICCATHENASAILETPEAVAEKLRILGCSHTAYPYPSGVDFGNPRAVKKLIKQLNNAGKVLDAAGITLSYHNHEIEFRRLKNRIILDMIFAETDPQYLKAELDTHWVQAGGASVTSWCRKMSGRMPLIHLKDFALTDERQRVFAEVGSGNMDWREIVDEAERSGCEWFIVEQDSNWVDNDPFKSLKMSYKYLSEQIAEE